MLLLFLVVDSYGHLHLMPNKVEGDSLLELEGVLWLELDHRLLRHLVQVP